MKRLMNYYPLFLVIINVYLSLRHTYNNNNIHTRLVRCPDRVTPEIDCDQAMGLASVTSAVLLIAK
jgi:hypothetical protein